LAIYRKLEGLKMEEDYQDKTRKLKHAFSFVRYLTGIAIHWAIVFLPVA
jgi:hypothetical protein